MLRNLSTEFIDVYTSRSLKIYQNAEMNYVLMLPKNGRCVEMGIQFCVVNLFFLYIPMDNQVCVYSFICLPHKLNDQD